MEDKIVEDLIQKTVQGNFKYVCKTISSGKLAVPEDVAVRILISCCRAVCSNVKTDIEELHLCNVLQLSIKFIHLPNDTMSKSYLQSVYHITAFLLEKGHYNLVIKLKDLLIPKFLNNCIQKEDLKKIYTGLCILIYNSIRNLKQHLPETILMNLYLISITTFSHCTETVKLLKVAVSYFQKTEFANADINLQCECFSYLCNSISRSTQHGEVNSDIYEGILGTAQQIVVNLMKKEEYALARKFLKLSLESCRESKHLILKNIIVGCFPMVPVDKGVQALITGIKKSSIDFKKLIAQNKHLLELQATCSLIFYIFQEFYELCKKGKSNTSEVFIETLLGFFESIAEMFAKTKMICHSCSSSCTVDTNLLMSINIHWLMARYVALFISNNTNFNKNINTHFMQSMDKCLLRISVLKKLNCQEWNVMWQRVRTVLFNLFIKMSHQKIVCFPYGCLLMNTELLLEQTLIIEPDIKCSTLLCMSENAYNDGMFETAAIFSALEIFYSGDLDSMSFNQWLKVKCYGSEDLKPQTIICVLTEKAEVIKTYFSNLNLEISKEKKIKILLRELQQYKQKYPSRIPMAAVLKKLIDIADPVTVAAVTVQTWKDDPLDNEEVVKLIPDIINNLSVESNFEGAIVLALLHIMQYRSDMEKLQDNMQQCMDSNKTPTVSDVTSENTNDNCSIISFVNLNLFRYTKTSQYLKTALNKIQNCFSDSFKQFAKDYGLYNVFEQVAFEFEMHGDSIQALHAWSVCLIISRIIEDQHLIIKSASFILKNSNVKSEIVNSIIKECSDLASTLISSEEVRTLEVLCQYSVNKCTMFLRHDEVEESLKEYQQLRQVLNRVPHDVIDPVLKIEVHFLEARHMQLPCNFHVENHEFALAQLFSVLNAINSHIKSNGGTRGIALLLEIYDFLIKMYKGLHLSREIRCYSRAILTFAQKQFLPLRVANTLTYMIYADTISKRFDDVRVKLPCLRDILGTISTPKSENVDLQELMNDLVKMSLEENPQRIDGSPYLHQKTIALPQCFTHDKDCLCFYCTSIEYKNLFLVYLTLQSHLGSYMPDPASAVACFKGAVHFYKYLHKRKTDFEKKVVKILYSYNDYFAVDLEVALLIPYGTLLLHYGNELLQNRDTSKAKVINDECVSYLTQYKRTNAYLYNESILQKVKIILLERNMRKQPVVSNLTVSTDTGDTIFKTPERSESTLTFTKSYNISGEVSTAPKQRIRKVVFNISPEITPSKTKQASIPSISGVKTPLKCKITDDPVQQLQTPSTNKYACILTEANEGNDSTVIPMSPNAYSPSASKIAGALENRTKLLLEKLQKSNVKIAGSEDNVENISNSIASHNSTEYNSSKTPKDHKKKPREVSKTRKTKDEPLQYKTRSKSNRI